MTKATGVDRLDEALGGGLDPGSTTLLYGPEFSGKELVARRFGLTGMAEREPSLFLVIDEPAGQLRDQLAGMDEHLPDYERENLLWFVDTHPEAVDAGRGLDTTESVPSAADLNAVACAVNRVLKRIVPRFETHRLVLDSASALAGYASTTGVVRFLQVLLDQAQTAGGTAIVLMDAGAHGEDEVEAVKRIVDGVLEVRSDGSSNEFRVQGFSGANPDPDTWVEYGVDDPALDVTGSLGESTAG